MPIYEKDWKENSGKSRTVSLTSVLGKTTEQIILSAILQHTQDNQRIRPRQCTFGKGRSFCDRMTHSVDEGRAVDVCF